LTIEDIDQKLMDLLMKVASQHLFSSRCSAIFSQDLVLSMQESSTVKQGSPTKLLFKNESGRELLM